MMGVSGLAGDPAYPPQQPPMPPLPLGKSGARFGKAMNKLGWHWWPSDSTIATRRLRGPRPLHQSRPLHAGLRAGRQGQHRHHLLAARAPRRRRAAHAAAACARSRVDEHGMASGVIYYDAEGKEQFQPAEVVIVACNGVGTPRLLLNSSLGKFPNGLANSSGLVGKNLMFHPYALDLRLCRRAARRQSRPAAVPVEPGVLRDRPGARFRARLHLPVRPRHRRDHGGDRQHRRGPPALGRGPSPRLSQAAEPSHRPVGDLRGPAGGAQPRDARSGAEGLATASRRRSIDYTHQRQQPEDDGPRHRAREGGARGGRRQQHRASRRRS